MSLIDKARELSGQVAEKAGELGADDLIANMIIRAAKKKERVNKILKEKGCGYRIGGIEVEAGLPPKTVFTITSESE